MRTRKKRNNKNITDIKETIWVYGRHGVFSVIENKNREIFEIFYIKKGFFYEKELSKLLEKFNIKIKPKKVDKKVFDKMVDSNIKHQGIAIKCKKLIIESYQKIFEVNNKLKNNIGILLDNVTDVNNIGTIYRNSCAFNNGFIITEERNCPSESNALINVSCGTYDKVSTFKVSNINLAIKKFKVNNWWIVGLDPAGKMELSDFLEENNYLSNVIFVLGSEGKGIRKLIKKNCDHVVKIKTNSISQSINVSNASAILLYNLNRFRNRIKS